MLSFDPFFPSGSYSGPTLLPVTSSEAQLGHHVLHAAFPDSTGRNVSHYQYSKLCPCHILICLQPFLFWFIIYKIEDSHNQLFPVSGYLASLENWITWHPEPAFLHGNNQLALGSSCPLCGATLFCVSHGPYSFLLCPSLSGPMPSADCNILVLMFFL